MATASTAVKEETAAAAAAPQFEDDDMVTLLRRNWGTPAIPAGYVDYLDRYTSVGGVVRNVAYTDAKKYVKLGLIAQEHVFPNNASTPQFAEATGRNPLSPENLASAVQNMTPEKAAAILGDETALAFAKALQKLVTTRASE
jgi:hypothetical protein